MRAIRPLHRPILHSGSLARIRSVHTSAALRYQHVLYFGNVLGYNSVDRLAKFPRAWLDSVGVSADVDHGLRWGSASGSPGHALLSYTLLESAVDPTLRAPRQTTEELATSTGSTIQQEKQRTDEGAEEETVLEDASGRKSASSQPSKVFSLGRNTHAQLGLGFSSQEATRGMVTGSMDGNGGVDKVVAGSGFSFVVTSSTADDGTHASNVYGFGNDTLGQLGASSPSDAAAAATAAGADPYDVSTRLSGSDSPQLRLLPLPKQLHLDASESTDTGNSSGWKVADLSAGVDHSLALLERSLNGFRLQSVLSTGLNTDGQLGVTPRDKADAVPMLPLLSRAFARVPGLPTAPVPLEDTGSRLKAVVCGADTSYVLTSSGDLWVWGNSEYGQSFAGVHDRIPAPTFVPNPLPAAYESRRLSRDAPPTTKKLVAGGSFAALLDDHGRVWVAGYGPRASTSDAEDGLDEWARLSLVQGFPEDAVVEDLFCGLEYLVAITRSSKEEVGVWIWGVPPRSVSSVPIQHPTPVPFAIPRTPRQQWLDENPRLKKDAAFTAEAERKGGRVSVEAAACARDHLLLVLNDGMDKDV